MDTFLKFRDNVIITASGIKKMIKCKAGKSIEIHYSDNEAPVTIQYEEQQLCNYEFNEAWNKLNKA